MLIAPHGAACYAKNSPGNSHLSIGGGVGHNLPQTPQAFAELWSKWTSIDDHTDSKERHLNTTTGNRQSWIAMCVSVAVMIWTSSTVAEPPPVKEHRLVHVVRLPNGSSWAR